MTEQQTAPGGPPATAAGATATAAARVTVHGVVQGVGFRPFVYTLATELGLAGFVANTGEGVVTEAEGDPDALDAFCARIGSDAPPLAVVESVTRRRKPPAGRSGFTIDTSHATAGGRTLVSPDTATCAPCLAELRDPADRRHRHPFVTCTHCGPRFTIVTGLPYDRARTTMAAFPLCPRCAREYDDPADRRFHAQPVACHDCGPRLRLVADGAEGRQPLVEARRLLAAGRIVAVKGLGGYHLACDAENDTAVQLLRRRKARGGKPFALMARDLADVAALARVTEAERVLLTGERRPIVLLRRHLGSPPPAGAPALSAAVAPGSADLGVMLPYTPLHHLLLGLPGDPPGPRLLVMTSANMGGEPIVTDDDEALRRLRGLADAWLLHDRPIQVPCDDSVVRVLDGEELPLRRSRGYAPFPLTLPFPVTPTLAVGGDLKNTCCLGEDRHAWLSAHIGDMDDLATLTAFDNARSHLEELTGVRPLALAADRHPGYRSAHWARRHAEGRPLHHVQHHHAHIASAMAENGLGAERAVIGVAFDGTGYGDDQAVWGGEFLIAGYHGYHRFAHLRYTPLPGGDTTVRRPYRMALAHLHAAALPWDADLPSVAACPPDEQVVLARQLAGGLGCADTSSAGRLFDAVASLAGVCHRSGYEAQAALELEAAAVAASVLPAGGYCFALRRSGTGALTADPAPVLSGVVADLRRGVPRELIAARFHRSLVTLVRRLCAAARQQHGLDTVALSGGVFANALLATESADGLRRDGFTVLRHRQVPPGDGGLALGQLVIAARQTRPAR